MQDTKLFETILRITTPWHVAHVQLQTEDKRVDLWLEHEPTRWPCPECGDVSPGFDYAEARTWRHLDTCQFQTHLRAEIPWVQCPAHGVKQVRVPWAEPRSRFTLLRLAVGPQGAEGLIAHARPTFRFRAWSVATKRHLAGVLRFAKHPITNGAAEGRNSKIMSIKRKAGGFRNPANFTTAIYFHCGGLDLYPR